MEVFREKVSDDFSPQTLEAFVEQMVAQRDRQKSWAVYADGELGGLITFERLSPWLGTAHLILKPNFQGRGIAVKVCRIAAAEAFALGVGKIAFYPLAGNLANGSLLINLGAKREGTLKAHTLCGGKPRDVWMYGLSKVDFEERLRNASSSITSTHTLDNRGRSLNRGLSPVGQAKDHAADVEHDAHVLPGDAEPHESALGVQ